MSCLGKKPPDAFDAKTEYHTYPSHKEACLKAQHFREALLEDAAEDLQLMAMFSKAAADPSKSEDAVSFFVTLAALFAKKAHQKRISAGEEK